MRVRFPLRAPASVARSLSFVQSTTFNSVHPPKAPCCHQPRTRIGQSLTFSKMTTNKMRPVHPGEILREEYLVPLGMTANALSLALRVPAPRINDIVRERRAITPDTALRLARYFDTTPEFWLNLQSAFDLKRAEQKLGQTIQREIQPMAVAA